MWRTRCAGYYCDMSRLCLVLVMVSAGCLFEERGFTQTPTKMDYDVEDETTRNARRKANWTPVVAFVEDRD